MAQFCSKCSRANPAEAVYCYFDGFVLGGQARNGGPVAVGAVAFAHPFVFAGGRSCRSFDELALACQEEWPTARDLLRQGFLENFFRGLGRADLSQAAKEAARFPDADRGLDQLLAALPTGALAEPHLRLETQEINLGVLSVGEPREFTLHLENQGMRLVHGTVTVMDGNWLAVGDAAGNIKHFQFLHELPLSLRVRSDKLRAHPKPLETHLEIESNGGSYIVYVRAMVPIKPFPSGVLAGAKSPRQVAEKAKAASKEAAELFESGAVAEWYKSNGWAYPVQGPAASGLGSIQQFFEALGLTAPPKVEISADRIELHGNIGDPLETALEVKSEEKRPVYAHAVSNQAWLEVGRPQLRGRVAVLPLAVPAVPNRPGETLTAKLSVQSNGNQRFVVPVTLHIGHNLVFGSAEAASSAASTAVPAAIVAQPVAPSKKGSGEHRRRAVKNVQPWMHALPAALLALAVFLVVLVDLLSSGSGDDKAADRGSGDPYHYDVSALADPSPLLTLRFNKEMKFGLEMSKERDPREPDKFKKLTYEAAGDSNNTIVKIDDYEYYFGDTGDSNNRWVRGEKDRKIQTGALSTMEFRRQHIRVTQHVQIVPGQSGYLDTCLVHYTIRNQANEKHKVGLRLMLDTYIGANDGVPFTIPGTTKFVNTKADLKQKQIPDYIEVIENPDNPKDPGTVARLGLRHVFLPQTDLEDLTLLRICRWPNNNRVRWEWKPTAIGSEDPKDSCVVLYWPYQDMNPGEQRDLAFTYGLGTLEIGAGTGTNLALSVPSAVPPDTDFVVTAYIWGASQGDLVKLQLPDGLRLADGESAEKTVEDGGERSQVFWHVKSGKAGKYTLNAVSGKARAKPMRVIVKTTSIFG